MCIRDRNGAGEEAGWHMGRLAETGPGRRVRQLFRLRRTLAPGSQAGRARRESNGDKIARDLRVSGAYD